MYLGDRVTGLMPSIQCPSVDQFDLSAGYLIYKAIEYSVIALFGIVSILLLA